MSQTLVLPKARTLLSLGISSALAGSLLIVTSVAVAQEPRLLEEVVVTAQKRTERLSDVPVAVSVLSRDQIEAAYANNIENLQAMVPSVSFRKGNTTRNSSLTVRGIGTISFSTAAEPSVSTVVDGVVLARSGQAFADLYDLERIEVLKGPQGTLFGKNASAGVVNMTTQRPDREQVSGYIDAQLYEDREYILKGRISGPITDTVAASLTMLDKQFDGYIENVFLKRDTNGYDRQGARAMIQFDPRDDLSMLFTYETYKAEDNCCTDLELLPSGRNIGSSAAPDSQGIVDGRADLDLGLRKVDHDLETITLDEHTGLSLHVDKSFGDYQLTSITAYRDWDNTEIREGDFSSRGGSVAEPVNFSTVGFQLHDIGPQSFEQISQELRLASPTGGLVDWQLGAFYMNIDSERSFTREASCQNNGGQLFTELGLSLGVAADDPAVQEFIDANNITCNANDIVSATANFNTSFDNWAVFGDGKLNLTDNFRVLFGLRYTEDDIDFDFRRVNNDQFGRRGVGVRPASEEADASGGTGEENLSGKLGVQFDFGDNHMAYATVSQGYKGPGFNVFFNFTPATDGLPIAEETSDSYELGYKFSSGRLMVNAALFRTEIEDFQANNLDNSLGTTTTRLTNAGDVETSGFELDFLYRPVDNLTLSGGIALIDAEIDKFNCPIPIEGQPVVACTERSGLPVPFAPEKKYTVMADYLLPLASQGMNVRFNASYVYTDDQTSGLPGNDGSLNPAGLLPSYEIVNASVSVDFDDGKYSLALIGKNLFDEQFVTTFSGDGFRYQVPRDAERYFGIGAKLNF